MRYVIIGNSAAGWSAAASIRSVDPDGAITMVSEEAEWGYCRIFLPDLIKGHIGEGTLVFRGPSWYSGLAVQLIRGRKAVSVDPSRREVALESGEAIVFDRLLIATGAQARALGIEGEDLNGVFFMRTLEDARGVRRFVQPGGSGVVLGGGLVGLKTAEALSKRGMRVTLVVSSEHVLAKQLDAAAAAIVGAAIERCGVRMITGVRPLRILGNNTGKVCAVELEGGEILHASVVIVAKGVRPRTELAKSAGLEVRDGIMVDDSMQSSFEGIYAAGDVAAVPSWEGSGRRETLGIWPAAVRQGRVAGLNMAGRRSYFVGMPPMNVAQFFDIAIASVGTGIEEQPSDHVVTYSSKGVYRKMVIRAGTIVGAIEVGPLSKVGIISWLVRRKATLREYQDLVLSGGFERMQGAFRTRVIRAR